MASLILTVLAAYLIGSFPTSLLIARMGRGIDIRAIGSGTVDAANVARVLGFRAATVVALVDGFKGFIPVMLVMYLRYPEEAPIHAMYFASFAGIAAVIGQVYPVFAGFRGGKGITTSAGALIALFPELVPYVAAVFLIMALATGIVSIASILSAVSLPIVYLLLVRFSGGYDFLMSVFLFTAFVAIFVLFTHRMNIARLFRGEEKRFRRIDRRDGSTGGR